MIISSLKKIFIWWSVNCSFLCWVLKIWQEMVFGDFLDRKKFIKYSSPMTSPLQGLSPSIVKEKNASSYDGHVTE